VVFTLLRTAALTALLLLSARLARLGANSHRPLAPLALAALLVVFRPIDNEYGNGQINSLICLGAVGGAALIMRGGARSILGIAAASLAAAVKPPPALVLAAPLLHRRGWAMSATAVAIAALMFGLPRVWHGAEGAEQLRREFARRAETMMRDARAKDRQTTLHEIIYFSLAQSRLDPDVRWTFDEGFHEEREGGRVRVRVPDPMSPNAMFSLWFAASAAVGGLYLLARRLLWRGAAPPWTWDVAALCVFVLLLEPILRKAHGVILVVPAAWILAQWGEEARLLGSWRSWAARNRPRATLGFIAAGGLWAGDDLPIPFSPTPMPYNISMFLALIAFLALLAIEARGRRRLGEPTHQCGRTV
jgi:hypothetical protein